MFPFLGTAWRERQLPHRISRLWASCNTRSKLPEQGSCSIHLFCCTCLYCLKLADMHSFPVAAAIAGLCPISDTNMNATGFQLQSVDPSSPWKQNRNAFLFCVPRPLAKFMVAKHKRLSLVEHLRNEGFISSDLLVCFCKGHCTLERNLHDSFYDKSARLSSPVRLRKLKCGALSSLPTQAQVCNGPYKNKQGAQN